MSEGTWTPIFYSEDRYFTFKLQTLPHRLGGAVGAVISEAPTYSYQSSGRSVPGAVPRELRLSLTMASTMLSGWDYPPVGLAPRIPYYSHSKPPFIHS